MKGNAAQPHGNSLISRGPCYEAAVFLMLVMAWVIQAPGAGDLNEYTAVYYVLPFSDFGFKSRLVIGSVVSVFADYVSNLAIYILIGVLSAVFIVLISLVAGRLMRIAARNDTQGAWILPTLLLACPLSLQYLFHINNYGRYDLFSIEIAVLLLFCVRSEKGKWALPFLCFFAMLLNYNFAVMYMPAVAAVMLYELSSSPKSRPRLAIFLASCAIVVGSFVYFKALTPDAAFADPQQVKQYLAGRTDVAGGEIPVFYDFCYSLAKIYSRGADRSYSWFLGLLKVYLPYALLSALPALIFFVAFWAKVIRRAAGKSKRLIFLLFALLPLFGLPMFLAIDWDRWFPTLFISQLMVLLYLVAAGDRDTLGVLRRLHCFLLRHELLTAASLLFLASGMYARGYSVYLSVMLKHIDTFLNVR